ncbi:MAG: DUF2335 domain-containing protein [Bacteroidales bacterium]|nr:DUF2335 domain-containing protein [Bacteroidales bacterium]
MTDPADEIASSAGSSAAIPEDVGRKIAENIPELKQLRNDKTKVVQQVAAAVLEFSGPLPPPSMLAGYDAVVPGSAERLLKMAEESLQHAHAMDRELVAHQNRTLACEQTYRMSGLILGFLAVIAVLALAGIFAWLGYPWLAAAFGGVTVAAVATAFVRGRFAARQAESATPAKPAPGGNAPNSKRSSNKKR